MRLERAETSRLHDPVLLNSMSHILVCCEMLPSPSRTVYSFQLVFFFLGQSQNNSDLITSEIKILLSV